MIFCVEDNASIRLWDDVRDEEISALCGTLGSEVLDSEGTDEKQLPHPVECSLFLVDEEEIRTLNRTHRGIDRVTDVLSFPNLDLSGAVSVSEALADQGADALDPETGHLLLGEIVLCTSRALAQAQEYGHSIRREFSFLVTHSLLHLIGYDHETEEEREVMEEKQEAVLRRLHITREEPDLG